MADPSKSALPLADSGNVLEAPCWADASSEPAYVTASAFVAALESERESETESANPSSSSSTAFFPACSELVSSEKWKAESGDDVKVEHAIERSKAHWSQLIEESEEEEEEAEVSNVKTFQLLQSAWGHFFSTFGGGGIFDLGELEVGEKFAKGGQAELYHARVTWKEAKRNLYDHEHGLKYVLKVFPKGTFLRNLKKQWPEGIFWQFEEFYKRIRFGQSLPKKFTSHICCGTLLQDGRFAFLIVREREDLRTLIDRCMEATTCIDCGPFSRETEIRIMWFVARGMFELHSLGIVHRDLKASNVLCTRHYRRMGKLVYDCNVANEEVIVGSDVSFYIADFECSIGVVGTGFFRAPEILQATKDKVVNKSLHLFTKEADVYSYGMLCYEILTGKLPFKGHRIDDYDLVLQGGRPEVPQYVGEWARDLLSRCWRSDPMARPSFGEILDLLGSHVKH